MNDILKDVCKIGQGAACCRYLVVGDNGFECCKVRPDYKQVIDTAWATAVHVAQGDNCEGKSSLLLNIKPETQN